MLIFVYCLWLTSGSADSQNLTSADDQAPVQGKISIPLVAHQLGLVDGVIPVELKCDATVLVLPNTLDQIPCTIRNNSEKIVTAVVLSKFITIDNNGKVSAESDYTTLDFFVHPDFHAKSKSKGLSKRSEPQFPSAQETYPGIIKQIEVHIDYVEFADKKTLGPNRKGADILLGIRAGAEKYKRWLLKQFETNGESADILVRSIVENQRLPDDFGANSASEEQGAEGYRNYLRRIYQSEGVEQLLKQWKKGNSIDSR